MRIERLERDKAKLIEERDQWKRRSEHLEKELEAALRAGRRQAAPFAKDRPQGRGGRPGRRGGAEYGKQGRRRQPTQVDETHAAPAPTTCPDCGGAVEVTGGASQYQEDLPEVRPLVRRFDIEVGHCSQCQRRVQGRHALQTSDALGAAGAQLGPNVAALVVELHTELGMPLEKVTRVLRTQFANRYLHGARGGRDRPAAPLVGDGVPQVVQVAVGDGGQAFEAGVTEAVEGAGAADRGAGACKRLPSPGGRAGARATHAAPSGASSRPSATCRAGALRRVGGGRCAMPRGWAWGSLSSGGAGNRWPLEMAAKRSKRGSPKRWKARAQSLRVAGGRRDGR